MYGKLFLIPTPLSKEYFEKIFTKNVEKVVNELNYFIAENKKSAHYFIKKICPKKNQNHIKIFELSKYDKKKNIDNYIKFLLKGYNVGLLSENGLPCIADPGSNIVLKAHKKNLTVVPLYGPCSIFMTLMASGLNGQRFTFHGYLPIKKKLLIEKIKFLEKNSKKYKQTQLFMETPYRNQKLLEILLFVCNKYTLLTIATEITKKNEMIKTKSILEWNKNKINIHKKPSLFALLSF